MLPVPDHRGRARGNPASGPRTFPYEGGLEARLAPREGDMLSLPFDQYARMRAAQNIAHALYSEVARRDSTGSEPYRMPVLDVGGYPGVLRNFLSPDFFDLSIMDVVPDDGTVPGYRQGTGTGLPYADGSFDLVVSLDTLEHIPAHDRDRFLAEMMRVSRHAAAIINPVQSVAVDLAEETLDEYIRWLLEAEQEQLAEHRGYGLPDFAATRDAFERGGWEVFAFPMSNAYNWLLMMVAKHYLVSMRDERATAFERTLDRFYNLTFNDNDRAEPAYRGAVVAVRPGLGGALEHLRQLYPPVDTTENANTLRLQLTELLMGLLNLKAATHENSKLREQLEHRERHALGLENTLQATEGELAGLKERMVRVEEDNKNKNEHILYLERLLQGIESGKVLRLTRRVSRLLGR